MFSQLWLLLPLVSGANSALIGGVEFSTIASVLLASVGTITMRNTRESQAEQVTEDELPVMLAVHPVTAFTVRQRVGHEYAAGPDRQERSDGCHPRPARHM